MTNSDLDACLDLLSHRHRRRTVQELRNGSNGEATIEEIVDAIREDSAGARTRQRVDGKRLAVELRHTHLPKLAAHDLVQYNADRGIVRYRPDAYVENVLDAVTEGVTVPNP